MPCEAVELGELEALCAREKREMVELVLLQERLEAALELRAFRELQGSPQ